MSSEEELSEVDTGIEEENEDDDDVTSDEDEEPNGVRHFTNAAATTGNKDLESGEAVRGQLEIWDGLLETRIKLQKPLASSNTLPPQSVFSEFLDAAPEETVTSVDETCESLRTLLEDLVGLQDLISRNNPAFSGNSAGVGGDEEINSDSDADEKEDDAELSPNPLADHELSLAEIEQFLEKRYRGLEPYRNATLEKWNSRTHQFTVGLKKNFSAFDQSPVKQITQIMSDKQRLLQRTQTPRTSYRVLGTTQIPTPTNTEDNTTKVEGGKSVSSNLEIFDDDDFYHVLLRELIERKTADLTDPIEISRQQIELSQLRKQTKKVVDSKATRDRKIKFDPHPKLVSFMAPQQTCAVTEQARNDIYKSLFGKLQRRNAQDGDEVASGLGEIRLLK